jgi:hypothetical protein
LGYPSERNLHRLTISPMAETMSPYLNTKPDCSNFASEIDYHVLISNLFLPFAGFGGIC